MKVYFADEFLKLNINDLIEKGECFDVCFDDKESTFLIELMKVPSDGCIVLESILLKDV